MGPRSLLFGVACLTSTLGCSNSLGPIHGIALSGNGQTDTVGATLRVPLTVHTLAHVPVLFESSGILESGVPVAYVNPVGSSRPILDSPFGFYDSTNSEGLVSVDVVFNNFAGVAKVSISVQGYSAVAQFTITPGKAVRVFTSPHDTAVFGGASLPLQVAGVDTYGNLRSDPSSIRILSGPATASGTTVNTTAVGRIAIVGSADGFNDTSYISAVPKGTLAAISGNDIIQFNLDGSGETTLTAIEALQSVRWSPSGKNIVYAAGGWIYDTPLVGSGIHAIDAPTQGGDHAPVYSRDGTWVYFARTDSTGRSSLWRVHPDGTGVIPLATQDTSSAAYPSPSPDGSQVAYIANPTGQATLRVLTVSTGAFTSLNTVATSPAWSPNSGSIATIIGSPAPDTIALVSTTGNRHLAVGSYYGGFDWSPDGQWLAAANVNYHIDLINVTTGEVLPLVFTGSAQSPAWKPTFP